MIGVFGASGFIGRNIIKRLISDRIGFRAISRHRPAIIEGRPTDTLDYLEADFEDSLAMESALVGVDTVIQLISTSSPGFGNRQIVADVEHNVIPHIKFMNSCAEVGVKRYIFVSSGGTVYGPTDSFPITESHPTNPISSHGLTKLTTEKYLQMFSHQSGMEYVILRLANVYGPGQSFHKGQGLIPAVLDRYERGEPIEIIGSGEARRDYVYIDDFVSACMAAANAPGPIRDVINIGSGDSRSIIEVLDAMEGILKTRFERRHREGRHTDVDVSQLDIRRAKDVLRWHPEIPFEVGLERMLSESAVRTGKS